MAAGSLKRAGLVDVQPHGAVKVGAWCTAHDDCSATAASAGVLQEPLTNSSANVHAVAVPVGARRVMIRGKHTGTTAVATSPIVSLFGVYGSANSALWFDNLSTTNQLLTIASAVTLTLEPTTDVYTRNATNEKVFYGARPVNAIDSNPWYDCAGASFVFVLVSTAASITTASADTPTVEVAFLD